MKKRKNSVQMIAVVLSILMILNIPLPVLAQASIENAIEEQQNQPVLLTDRLTETETYWQNADGSISYEAYFEPIRYQDENGAWHEIENDVVQIDKSEESTDPFKNEGYAYRSESSKNWVLFDEDIRGAGPIKMIQGGLSITMKPLWSQTVEEIPYLEEEQAEENPFAEEDETEPAEGENDPVYEEETETTPAPALPESRLSFIEKEPAETAQANARAQRRSETTAQQNTDAYTYSSEKEYRAVAYSNVFEQGISLQLEPGSQGLKEDIILTKRPEIGSFSFEIEIEGATLELENEEGVVLIKDEETDEVLGYIPQPYMTDAGVYEEYEKINFDIGVELLDLGQGKYRYTLMPSDAFLDAEDTVYPVRIDPSVTISGAGSTQDTYVDSSNPNKNYYTNQYLRVGKDSDGAVFRSLLRFDLPSDIGQSYISKAELHTYQSYNGRTQPKFGLYRIRNAWVSKNATWNSVAQSLTADGPYVEKTIGNVGDYTWDITSLARVWSAQGNYGLMIKSQEENNKRYKRFYSSDASAHKPSLQLTYRPINKNISVSATAGGNNSSKGNIKVSWTAQTGVKTKVYLDGTATEATGSSYTWTNQVSGVDHKVKVEFYTTYGVKVTSEEKTIKIPDNSPPVFDDFGQAYIDSENKVALKFHPAVKPGSVTNVTFPTWSNANGQDDLVYHNAVHDGQGNWSCVISIADHKNEYGSYAIHLGGYNANNVRIAFGHIFPSINANGELYNVQKNVFTDSDPVCRDITAEPVSNTSFKITAYGLQSRNQISKYEIYWAEAGKTEKHLIESIGGDEYQLISRAYDPQEKGLPSGKTIYFSVKAFDKNGNYTTMDLPSNPVEIPNYITPQKASALSVTNAAGESYTFAETPLFGVKDTAEIHWELEKGTDSEYDVSMIQYKVDDGEWLSIDPAQMTNSTAGPKQNGYAVPLDGKTEGLHTISVRGVDNNSAHPLSGPERTIQVLRDITVPNVTMAYPEGEGDVPNWEYGDTVRITNVEDAQLKQVQAYIGKKLPWDLPGLPAVFEPVSLAYTKNEAGQDIWPADIALAGGQLTADGTYVLRVVATDTAGNQSVEEKTFNLTMPGQVEVQGKQLQLQYQAQNGAYCIENRINEIVFTAVEGTILPNGAAAKLFVDGHEAQATVNLETGQVRFTVDVLGEENAALFEQGKTKNLYAVVYDQTSGTKWVSQPVLVKTEELLIEEDTFAALTGFSVDQGALVNSAPQTGDSFEIQGVENGYGLLDGVTVTAEECPANVKFEVRFFDGSQYGAPVVVASGQTAVFDYQAPENAGKSPYGYKIKGIVTEGGDTAISLSGITIKETYITAADKTVTNLVKTPENLSAQAMVNYTTWLRWEDNEEKEGVYDVYRKAAGTTEEERIAENLTEPYCYDYNLMYGQSFEYRVVKKVSYAAGEDIKQAVSQASQSVSATMVDQAEMDKSLGLQDYWSYVTSDMGNGTGYINVASGNLVYQKTDFANTAPLLATVMRRTYNSQSRAGSGLGQGWDFSFNTNLLVEYGQEETGERAERAVLLKDGDGTVHRYEKQADGSYLAPNGIFLTLEKQADGRYKAVRSDDIVYMFNQNMMIESFAEPNGNQLLFRYDEKGRLVYVMHSQYAGETFTDAEKQYVELVYGEQPYNRDKIIMAKNVFAGAPGQQQTAQVYRYTYYDEPDQRHYGQLKRVETSVERPITIYNRQTNAQGEEEESVSESQERLTMYEEYEYPNTEAPKVKIITPSNNGVGTRQSSLTLDETGRVTEYINANGDTSTLTYTDTEQGHRQTVITNKVDGHTLGSIGYITDSTNHGVVLQTTAVNGRKTHYENYTDTLQAQTIRTYQDSEETAAVVYQMTYDSRGNVLTVTAPDGVLTTNTYVAGKDWLASQTISKNGTILNKTAYTYDDKGNLLTAKTAVSDPAAFTDTKTTAYTYNAQGLRVSQTDWNGRQTGYTYDKFGRLSESTVSGSGISQTTRYTYDAYNNLVTATAERGAQDITTQTQYDTLGYLIKSTDPTGMKQAYRYNANGLQTETLTMGYTSAGAFVEAKKTTVQYDEINRAIQTTLTDGTVQTVGVSGKEGAIETNTESTGTDGVVRTGKTQTAADGSYVKQTSLGLGSKTTYDYIGNMNRVVQIHGETEERGVNAVHDVMGRTTHVWDDTFSVESYTEYDDLGNVCREWTYVKTEGETRKYTVKGYTHDLEGRVTSVKEYTNLLPHGEIGSGEPTQTTAYRYDESAGAGLIKQTVTDAEGGVSESYFNQLGQTVKQVQKGRNAEKQIVTVCSYDAYGRQIEVKQGDQTTQTTKQSYEYDAYDRIKTQRTNGSTYTELAYDHFGRRNRMTDHTDSTQIVSSWLYNKRDQAQYVMQDGKIMGFTYNSAGEMTTIRYSAGNTMEIEGAVRTVAYDYDELGRLTAVKSGVVDTSNASLDTTNVKTVKDYTYAENGDLTTSREYMEFDTKADLQGVSLVQSYAYDAVGRPTEVAYKQGEAVKEKYTQSYDGRNYITQDSYTDGYGSTAKTLNRTYQYDAIGRLTETGVTNGEKTKTTGYQYDKVGNRLYQTVADGTKMVSTKYTYNALGQLTATQKGLGTAGSVTNWLNEELYTYDACGNQTGVEVYEVNDEVTSTEKAGDVRYTYDEANQMVKYETKGTEEESWTEKARNVYNGEGMRIRQYENGNSWARQYFYIGGALSISTDGSNENYVKSENILTPDGTILAALREAKAGEEIEGNAYWIYHYDARGSATNLVGAKNGSLYRAEENIYDAFGNKEEEIKQSTSSVVNDIKFTGAVLDNSGTYYLGSRHYDPNTGRFLQQDTFKGDVYSPWTQNLYTYTSNNPVNYVDPTGHYYKEIFGDIGQAMDSIFGNKNRFFRTTLSKLGEAADKKYETTETPEEMKKLARQQRSIKKSKATNTYGGGYNEHKANILMEIMIVQAADEQKRTKEQGAFVYQREDGKFYISNVLEDKILNVSEAAFYKEAINLGLLDAGKPVELSFGHTHALSDEKVVKGPSRSTFPKNGEDPENAVSVFYGSDTDAETIYNGNMKDGWLLVKNYVIYSPFKTGNGWNVERRPKTPTWCR